MPVFMFQVSVALKLESLKVFWSLIYVLVYLSIFLKKCILRHEIAITLFAWFFSTRSLRPRPRPRSIKTKTKLRPFQSESWLLKYYILTAEMGIILYRHKFMCELVEDLQEQMLTQAVRASNRFHTWMDLSPNPCCEPTGLTLAPSPLGRTLATVYFRNGPNASDASYRWLWSNL